jgi:nitrogen regulatory protein P-II
LRQADLEAFPKTGTVTAFTVLSFNKQTEMKLIIAYIKPEQLGEVKKELFKNQIYRLSVTNALGCGRQRGYSENYRGNEMEVNLLKKVRLEIGVNDEFLDITIESIIKGAQTDHIGDGKIFVLDMQQCIRVRTRETGPEAIG